MMRRVFLPIFAAATIATLAVAGDPPRPDDETRLQQLERNYYLIQWLVEGGLSLAGEDDPLKRADYCTDLAQRWAGEVHQAAVRNEEARAIELGEHLNELIKHGVTHNLDTVRKKTPSGSAREGEMQSVCKRAAEQTMPLEQLLDQPLAGRPDEVTHVLESVRRARQDMERAIKLPAIP